MRRALAAALALAALTGCGARRAPQRAAARPAAATAAARPATTTAAPASVHRHARPHRTHHRHRPRVPAAAPSAAATQDVSPGAPSDAEVRAELDQLYGKGAAGTGAAARRVVLAGDGTAQAPPDAPRAVQAIVAAADQVARLPYVYGGGHGRGGPEGVWLDSAYDCSGSVSFALASAGFIDRPMDSTALAHWGAPGPGRWVTIYANRGHAFMVVGGVRFDTVGLRQTGSRWQASGRTVAGFTERHPTGL